MTTPNKKRESRRYVVRPRPSCNVITSLKKANKNLVKTNIKQSVSVEMSKELIKELTTEVAKKMGYNEILVAENESLRKTIRKLNDKIEALKKQARS